MRVKNLYIIMLLLLQTAAFSSWAQSFDDIFEKENSNTKPPDPKDQGGMMMIDYTTPQVETATPEEIEQARQDSIKKINDNWREYFIEKNEKIDNIGQEVSKIDTSQFTVKNKSEYERQIKKHETEMSILQKEIDDDWQTRTQWKDNKELDKLRHTFNTTKIYITEQLEELKNKLSQIREEEVKTIQWWVFLLIGFGALMIGVQVWNQVKAKRMVKKAKKEQEQQVKQQREEAERQMLLADGNNIVTIKE
jgi:hypothetical protein